MPQGVELVSGEVERIGSPRARHIRVDPGGVRNVGPAAAADHRRGFEIVLRGLTESAGGLRAIGHRVVHGGELFREAVKVDDATLEAIRSLAPLARLHNPINVMGIEVARRMFPGAEQVAVFDTAFHRTLPERAYTYALPASARSLANLRRFGFHGISYSFVARRAAAFLGRPAEELNLIALHLGSGSERRSDPGREELDTSMGMTPLEGLVMGTASGRPWPRDPLRLARNRARRSKKSAPAGRGERSSGPRRLGRHARSPPARRRGRGDGAAGRRSEPIESRNTSALRPTGASAASTRSSSREEWGKTTAKSAGEPGRNPAVRNPVDPVKMPRRGAARRASGIGGDERRRAGLIPTDEEAQIGVGDDGHASNENGSGDDEREPALRRRLRRLDAYGGPPTTFRSARSISSTTLSCGSRSPSTREAAPPRTLGHDAAPQLRLCPLNRLIQKLDLNAIYIAGPGHGEPGVVANTYPEGTYSEVYSRRSDRATPKACDGSSGSSRSRRHSERRRAGNARVDP